MLYKNSPCVLSLVVLTILTFPTVVIGVEETAKNLLGKVVSNFQLQSYEASAVYIRPSGMESINIKHEGGLERISFNDNEEYERSVTMLNNKEIHQAGGGIRVHNNKTHFNALRHFQKNLAKGLKSYDLFISKHYDQVAGIQTARLSVISKNNDRYSYIYWIDTLNNIVLRTDTLNETGELIERMVFTSFALKKTTEHSISQIINLAGVKVSHYHHEANLKARQIMMQWLPSNFTVFSRESIYDDEGVLSYKFILLTDGFASIGIYLGHYTDEAKLTRGEQLDAFHVFKRTINANKISIEGQLPYEILEKIGLNIMVGNSSD